MIKIIASKILETICWRGIDSMKSTLHAFMGWWLSNEHRLELLGWFQELGCFENENGGLSFFYETSVLTVCIGVFSAALVVWYACYVHSYVMIQWLCVGSKLFLHAHFFQATREVLLKQTFNGMQCIIAASVPNCIFLWKSHVSIIHSYLIYTLTYSSRSSHLNR